MKKRKITLSIISFGISWLVALIEYLLKIPYGGLSSRILTAGLYMTGPAIAILIIR